MDFMATFMRSVSGHVRVLWPLRLNVKIPNHANTAEEMLKEFGEKEFAGKRFLFVRGEKSSRTIPDSIGGKADVDEVAVYKTEKAESNEAAVRDRQITDHQVVR